jgi:hypothetical protein
LYEKSVPFITADDAGVRIGDVFVELGVVAPLLSSEAEIWEVI